MGPPVPTSPPLAAAPYPVAGAPVGPREAVILSLSPLATEEQGLWPTAPVPPACSPLMTAIRPGPESAAGPQRGPWP